MKRFLAIAFLIAVGPAAHAQQCPSPVPPLPTSRPANTFEVTCTANQKCESTNPSACQRCGGPIGGDDCDWMIDTAFSANLIDTGARDWLRNNLFCPVSQALRTGTRLIDICPRGCFAAETSILVAGEDGAAYIQASALQTSQAVFAVSDESTMEELSVAPRHLKRIVHGPEIPELYVFHLSTGKELKVTLHHPMVLADGTVVKASNVPADASFLDVQGQPVSILEITREKTDKEVFNVWTDSNSLQGHVIVAEGVLTGDLELQENIAHESAMIELRR